MTSSILLVLGVGVLALALRSFRGVLPQKLGGLCLFLTSFLAGYLIAGSLVAGFLCASSWLLLPWVEILTRVRGLRLPGERAIRSRTPPSREQFPALGELTEEIEGAGFDHLEDAGWDWENYSQFYRIFHKPEERHQAAICMVEQSEIGFFFMSVSSRDEAGNVWTTWNFPFSYSLEPPPTLRINRVRPDEPFGELLARHVRFLDRNGVAQARLLPTGSLDVRDQLRADLEAQVTHNIRRGILLAMPGGDLRYTWRGFFYLWFQFLSELVRIR